MPKPNYAFAKRQRDLAKKLKKEEKKQKKAAQTDEPPADAASQAPVVKPSEG
ncbi:MAG: hypothetical protein MUC55_09540 [Burkholderiales bacterium]|nr:hypothetical protein [Burkholderiales bacterium]